MVSFTAGGAGYGDPLERPPELVREDVLDRKVSEEAARNEYGVVLFPSKEDIFVDMNATEELRAKMREIRGSITWTFDRGGDLGRE
jgi:N-methylhydantoinase B